MANIDDNYFTPTSSTTKTSVNSYLSEDEKILWKGRPKKSAYVAGKSLKMMPIAIIWLLIDGSIIAGMIFGDVASSMPPFAILFLLLFFALHLMPVWIWIGTTLKASKEMKTIEYVITNKRIIEFRGEPMYIYEYIGLNEILTASLKPTFIDKLLKVGDIIVYAEGKEIKLCDIPNSVFLHSKIMGLSQEIENHEKEFYDEKVECKHCDTYFDAHESRCPSCGAPNKGNR